MERKRNKKMYAIFFFIIINTYNPNIFLLYTIYTKTVPQLWIKMGPQS